MSQFALLRRTCSYYDRYAPSERRWSQESSAASRPPERLRLASPARPTKEALSGASFFYVPVCFLAPNLPILRSLRASPYAGGGLGPRGRDSLVLRAVPARNEERACRDKRLMSDAAGAVLRAKLLRQLGPSPPLQESSAASRPPERLRLASPARPTKEVLSGASFFYVRWLLGGTVPTSR